jgi:hypothetical protein
MKRVTDKSRTLFKAAKLVAQPVTTNTLRKYSFNSIRAFENSPLSVAFMEVINREAHKSQNNFRENGIELVDNPLLTTLKGLVGLYNFQLEQAKKLLDERQIKVPKQRLSKLVIELEQLYSLASQNTQGNLLQAYQELLAKAYTYEGLCYYCTGTKGENIALTNFEKALKIIPDYELPRKKKESILMGRGILPEGESLVFEDGFEITSNKPTL